MNACLYLTLLIHVPAQSMLVAVFRLNEKACISEDVPESRISTNAYKYLNSIYEEGKKIYLFKLLLVGSV